MASGPSSASDTIGRPILRIVTTTADKARVVSGHTVVRSGEAEPIFPPFLKTHPNPPPLRVLGKAVTWVQPSSLPQLLDVKARMPYARLVAGNTEVGIETKFKGASLPVVVCTKAVHALSRVNVLRGDPATATLPHDHGEKNWDRGSVGVCVWGGGGTLWHGGSNAYACCVCEVGAVVVALQWPPPSVLSTCAPLFPV
jgi:hypothetical protein